MFGGPGTGTVAVVPDSFRSAVALTLRNTSNLLSVQQADFETTTDGAEYNTTNCTVDRDTSVYYAGVASGKLTASTAATGAYFTDSHGRATTARPASATSRRPSGPVAAATATSTAPAAGSSG